MLVQNPARHILFIYCTYLLPQHELCIHLVHHGLQRRVGRVFGTFRDVVSVVCESEVLVLIGSAYSSGYEIHHLLDLFGLLHLHGGAVELDRIVSQAVHIVGLLVDLIRIQSGGQNQRRIHQSAAAVREERLGEVQQAVQGQYDAVLVPVAVPSFRRMEERMSVASAHIGVSDDPAQDSSRSMRRESERDVPYQIRPVLDVVVSGELVELLEFVIQVCCDLHEVVSAVLGGNYILDLELAYLLRIDEWIPVPIMGVAQLVGLLYAQTYLPRFEMGQGDIGHIESDRPVLEAAHAVLLPEYALLHSFACLGLGYQHIEALQFRLALSDRFERGLVLLFQVYLHGGGSKVSEIVGFGSIFRVGTADSAPVPERVRFADRTQSVAYFDGDLGLSALTARCRRFRYGDGRVHLLS